MISTQSVSMSFAAVLMCGMQAAGSLAFAFETRADRELAQLLRAKSVQELVLTTSSSSELEATKQKCEAELALKVIPKSCFRALRLENKKEEGWLVKECVSRAKLSASRIDLTENRESLPAKCQSAVQERLADLNYLDQSERPSELWTLERNVN